MDINQKQKERLEQQFAFIREIDKEKFIGRQTYLTDGERKENDAEHAWHCLLYTSPSPRDGATSRMPSSA